MKLKLLLLPVLVITSLVDVNKEEQSLAIKESEIGYMLFTFNKNNIDDSSFFGTISIKSFHDNSEPFYISLGVYSEIGSYTKLDNPDLENTYILKYGFYKFNFNIPLYEIRNNFRIKIEYSISEKETSFFFVNFSSNKISTYDSNIRLVEEVTLNKFKLNYKYLNLDLKNLLSIFNNMYYFDLKFKNKYFVCDTLSKIDNISLYIYDNANIYKDIARMVDNYSFFDLNMRLDNDKYLITNENKYYLEQNEYTMKKNRTDYFNKEVKNIYFPINLYEYFQNREVGIYLKNVNDMFDINFKANLKFESSIRKNKDYIVESNISYIDALNYEEIYI